MRVLVFGDSIAQGFWDPGGGWVARLRKYYDERQLEDLRNRDEPTIFNLGISGGRSGSILERLDNEVKARIWRGSPLVIIISTGTNDSYREGKDKFHTTSEQYRLNLELLAARAKQYTDKVMFVGLVAVDELQTVPVFWKDISYLNDRLKEFEEIMRDVASKNEVSFVALHSAFKEQLDAGKKFLADGAHPNANGHEFIFQQVRQKLDKLIG